MFHFFLNLEYTIPHTRAVDLHFILFIKVKVMFSILSGLFSPMTSPYEKTFAGDTKDICNLNDFGKLNKVSVEKISS